MTGRPAGVPCIAMLLAAVSASCVNSRNADDSVTAAAVSPADTLWLSAANPTAAMSVAAAALAEADLLSFNVTSVENPDGLGVVLDVALRADAGDLVHVGSVALFPVDQGGAFVLRIPRAVRDKALAAARSRDSVEIAVRLSPDPEPPARDRRALAIVGLRLQRSS